MGPTRRLNAEEKATRESAEVLEKDAIEIALEKKLFGDPDTFLQSLTTQAKRPDALVLPSAEAGSEDGSLDGDEDMEDVADDDLFFLDAGTATLRDDIMQDLVHTAQQDEAGHDTSPLWHDSDDEHFTVSLASKARLRKLRHTEDDDLVSGREYIQRLRQQYERLHPTPDWAHYARKKRKTQHGGSSDSDSDFEYDLPDVQPLSDLLRSTASLIRSNENDTAGSVITCPRLRPDVIDIQRLKDIAGSGPSSIDSLQFHPSYPLVLTAGPSSTINLYHLSPTAQNPNPILTSLHVSKTAITAASFAQTTVSDTKVYLAARRRFFHAWSLKTGSLTKISRPLYQSSSLASRTDLALTRKSQKNHELPTCENLIVSSDAQHLAIISNTGARGGVLHILNATTHQPVSQIRVDSQNGIAKAVFYRDGTGLSIIAKSGEVAEYNIAEKRVIARWFDEGGIGSTTAALGGEIRDDSSRKSASRLGNDRFIAIGSKSGMVNIYDRIQIMQHVASESNRKTNELAVVQATSYRPTPLRSIDNLTTPISHLHFSPDTTGQLLVMASRWKKDALRLVHIPSCAVYKNWPTDKTPLGRVSSVAISPNGSYLAVGNEAGKVKLWQIRD